MRKKLVAGLRQAADLRIERLKMSWEVLTNSDMAPSNNSNSPTPRDTASPWTSGEDSNVMPLQSVDSQSSSSTSSSTDSDSSSERSDDEPWPPFQFFNSGGGELPDYVRIPLEESLRQDLASALDAPNPFSQESLAAASERMIHQALDSMAFPAVIATSEDAYREWRGESPSERDLMSSVHRNGTAPDLQGHIPFLSDSWVEVDTDKLDYLIDSYLNRQHCSLWGQQWTIAGSNSEATRAKACAFIRKVILEVLEATPYEDHHDTRHLLPKKSS